MERMVLIGTIFWGHADYADNTDRYNVQFAMYDVQFGRQNDTTKQGWIT